MDLNKVIDYIEKNLTNDITLADICKVASCSDYALRNVFYYLTGLTLSEYIKYRKLSEANKDLLNNEKVTDVAHKYGYESVDGFSRAFKAWSGLLPSEAAKLNICKTLPKLTFNIDVKGGNSMDYRIVEMPKFFIAGVSKRVTMQFEGVNNAIMELAQSITQEQREEMHALKNIEPFEVVNASYEHDYDFQKDEGELTHMIGVLTTRENIAAIFIKSESLPAPGLSFPTRDLSRKPCRTPMLESTRNGCLYQAMRLKSFPCFLLPRWTAMRHIARFGLQ